MGQYYAMVCLDKHEFIHPWNFGTGAKEIEFMTDSLFLKAIAWTLSRSSEGGGGDIHDYQGEDPLYKGRWHGCRVKIVGDYDKSKHYERADKRYIDISKYIIGEMLRCDAFLLPRELEQLIRHYTGDENKKFRQQMHIAMTYSKKFWEE